ncbi:MAG: RNA polymerase sigma factor [Deltaproteobacteria bacterium]|nr:RNA polymerase sigma factor [Deltaproteobacteria bacterium]
MKKGPQAPAVVLDDARLRALYPRVKIRLLRFLGPRQDLEDVVQATMETLVKVSGNYQGRGSIESFAEGVAVNVARRYLAVGRLRRRVQDAFSETVVVEDTVVDNRDDVQSRRRLRRLMGILDTMGPRRRMAFVLHAIEGKPMREVAEMLSITPQAVKSRVFQARREILRKAASDPYLREFLEELDG